jgi:hypothetical protein
MHAMAFGSAGLAIWSAADSRALLDGARCCGGNCLAETIMRIDEISEDGIGRLVDGFYAKVRADPELAPIFNCAIPADWGPISRQCATSGRRCC